MPLPPDPDDEAALKAAKEGVASVLKKLSLDRSLRSLNWDDLETIARGAVNGWILKRAELSKHNPTIRSEILADAQDVTENLGELPIG